MERSLRFRVQVVPVFLLLGVFAVDKIALIPSIRDAGRKPSTPMENLQYAIVLGRAAAAADPRPEFVVLGTSRTKAFRYLHPETIRRDPWVSDQERRRLLGIRFETGTVLPAAEMLVQMTYVREYLRQIPKPDLFILEVSPGMFNANSQNSMELFLAGQVYETGLLWQLAPLARGTRLAEVLTLVAFPSYSYGFRPENAIRNVLRGRDFRTGSEMAMKFITMLPRTKRIPAGYIDLPDVPEKSEAYRRRIEGHTEEVSRQYLRNFEFDTAELGLLSRIIDLARQRNVPVVLWRPRVHSHLMARTTKLGINEAFLRVEDLIRQKQAPYYSAAADSGFACRRFPDTSHLSARCQPYLMARILRAAEAAYGSRIFTKRAALLRAGSPGSGSP